MSNVLNALSAFERVDEVERTEVFGESFANRLRGSLCVAEVGSVLSLSMYVALTYIPGGGLLTGFAMRSDPKGFSGLVHH